VPIATVCAASSGEQSKLNWTKYRRGIPYSAGKILQFFPFLRCLGLGEVKRKATSTSSMKILGQNLELFSMPEGSILTGSKSRRNSAEFLMEFQNRLILKKSLKYKKYKYSRNSG
jgi:hypothetical protein